MADDPKKRRLPGDPLLAEDDGDDSLLGGEVDSVFDDLFDNIIAGEDEDALSALAQVEVSPAELPDIGIPEEVAPDAPEEEVGADAAEEEVAADAPQEEPGADAPEEEVAADAPQEEAAVAEASAAEPAAEDIEIEIDFDHQGEAEAGAAGEEGQLDDDEGRSEKDLRELLGLGLTGVTPPAPPSDESTPVHIEPPKPPREPIPAPAPQAADSTDAVSFVSEAAPLGGDFLDGVQKLPPIDKPPAKEAKGPPEPAPVEEVEPPAEAAEAEAPAADEDSDDAVAARLLAQVQLPGEAPEPEPAAIPKTPPRPPKADDLAALVASLAARPAPGIAKRRGPDAELPPLEAEPAIPLAERLAPAPEDIPAPRQVLETVDAAPIDADHWKELLELYAAEIQASRSRERRASLHFEAGRLCADRLDDPESAKVHFRAALRVSPRHVPAMRAQRRLLEDGADWEDALRIIDVELAVEKDPRTLAWLHLRKGRLLELHAPAAGDAAVRASFERTRQAAPDSIAAASALADLAYRRKDMNRFLSHRKEELNATQDALERAAIELEIGVVRELVKGETEPASAAYRRAMESDPTSLVAAMAAARAAARLGDEAGVSIALETQAGLMGAAAEKSHSLYAAARAAARAGDRERAAALLAQTISVHPSPPALALLAEQGSTNKVEVLRQLAEQLGEGPGKGEVHYELALLLHRTLGDSDAAASELQQALAEVPDHPLARQLQQRLHAEAKRYKELAEAWEAAGAAASGPVEADWYSLAGDARERLLDDSEGAGVAYSRALAAKPDHGFALDGARRLWGETGMWGRIGHAVYAAAEADLATGDPGDALNARAAERLLWAGELFERAGEAEHTALAVTSYQRSLELAPRLVPALEGLIRIHSADGELAHLGRVLELRAEAADPSIAASQAYRRRSAEALAACGDEAAASDAVQRLQQAALADPSSPICTLSCERSLLADGRYDDLLAFREAQLARLRDTAPGSVPVETLAGNLIATGEIMELQLGRADDALACYRQAIEAGACQLDACHGMRRIHLASGDDAGHLAAMIAQADHMADVHRRVATLMEVAGTYARNGDVDRAIEFYRAAQQADPTSLSARRELLELLAQRDDHEGLAAVAAAEVDAARADAEQAGSAVLGIALVRRARTLAEMPEKRAEALEVVSECLALEPDNARALRLQETLSARGGDWECWCRTQLRFSQLFAEPADSGPYRFGAVLAREVEGVDAEDLPPAAEEYRAVLFTAPESIGIQLWLYYIARRTNDIDLLAEVVDRMAATVGGGTARAALLTRLGALKAIKAREEHGDDDAALLWAQALDADSGYLPALKRLRRRAEATGDTEALARHSEAEGTASCDPQLSAEAWTRAGVAAEELGDSATSREALKHALAQQPTNTAAFERLVTQLEAADDDAGLRDVLSIRASAVSDLRARRALLMRLGSLLKERLGDAAQAIEVFKQIVVGTPDDLEALGELATLYFEQGQWRETAATAIRLIKLDTDRDAQALHFFRLGLIYESKLPDLDRAVQSFQRAVRRSREPHIDGMKHLVELHCTRQEWDAAVKMAERLLEVEPNPHEKVRHHLRLARIHEEHRTDQKAALMTVRRALQIDQGNLEALELLAGLFERAGNARARQMELDRAAQIYRTRIRHEPTQRAHYRGLFQLLSWAGRRKQLEATAALLDLLGERDPEVVAAVPMAPAEGAAFPDATPMLSGQMDERWSAGSAVVLTTLAHIGPYLGKVAQIDTSRFGVGRSDRVDSGPQRDLIIAAARAFGIDGIELYTSQRMPNLAIALHPNTVVVGAGLLHGTSSPQLRFIAARILYLLKRGAWVLPFIAGQDFGRILLAAAFAGGHKGEADAQQEQTNKGLIKAIPRRTRKELAPLGLELSARASEAKELQFAVVNDANRIGMVMAGSVKAAITALGRFHGVSTLDDKGQPDPVALMNVVEISRLASFAVSEEYQMMRGVLGLR